MALFSPEHLAALVVTAALAVALTVVVRRAVGGVSNKFGQSEPIRHTPLALVVARALAIVILVGFVVEQATYAARGDWSMRVNLPLQLSDAVTLIAIVALWRPRSSVLTELVWFWALSASLQAVATPDLGQTFPDVLYFTYFATHSGAIVAACVLVVGLGLPVRRGGARRAFGFTAAFATVAAIGCLATGGNYMFLRRKPSTGSILDSLGPWPWYIAAAAALGFAMLLALEALGRVVARPQPGARASAAAPAGRR